ncbi:MAG: alpha/beta hydrolase-fold protein [Deinococcaceae bacterium]
MPIEITHNRVKFIPPPNATALIGDFTNWDRSPALPVTSDLCLEFPRDAWVEFAWLDADGKGVADPDGQPTHNPWYNWARGFEIGTYGQHALCTEKEPVPAGRVDRHVWESKVFPGTRRAYIYTPPDSDGHTKYPVYFVQDGVAFYRTGRLTEMADRAIAQKNIDPMVLVFVEPRDRSEEYYLNPKYADLLEELLPHVESHYPVRQDAAGRGLWGASLGGLISLYTAMQNPGMYTRVVSHSGAFIAHPNPPRINGKPDPLLAGEWLLEAVSQNPPKDLRISLDTGILEWLCAPNRRMAARMSDLGIPHQYREYASGHNWVTWKNAIPEALIYIQAPGGQ